MPINNERTNEEGQIFLNNGASNGSTPENRKVSDNDYSRIRRSTAGVVTTQNSQAPSKNYRATFGFANDAEFRGKLKNFNEKRKLIEYPKAKL